MTRRSPVRLALSLLKSLIEHVDLRQRNRHPGENLRSGSLLKCSQERRLPAGCAQVAKRCWRLRPTGGAAAWRSGSRSACAHLAEQHAMFCGWIVGWTCWRA
jgi:hypothetical protein